MSLARMAVAACSRELPVREGISHHPVERNNDKSLTTPKVETGHQHIPWLGEFGKLGVIVLHAHLSHLFLGEVTLISIFA
jgi:hypothetical protein